ncbi:MAG: hypothetical protein NTW86_32615 [Candidatus Sumerlaeota bacterium]|nr:hypothetical protein [Candidatus Sumerlaeota bacterium]
MKRLEGKTHEEILEYYRQQDEETKAEIQQLRTEAAARAGKN